MAKSTGGVGGNGPRCTRGKSCGATCIDPRERCVLELGPLVSESTSKVSSLVQGRKRLPEEEEYWKSRALREPPTPLARYGSRSDDGKTTKNPGDIKSFSTQQLQMLSNRPELDPRQKSEVMKELAARREEDMVKKMKRQGGYAPPKESGKVYKKEDWWENEEIKKQSDIFKKNFPEANYRDEIIGGKLLKYGATLSDNTKGKPELEYYKPEGHPHGVFRLISKVGKNETVLEVDTGKGINWTVNDSYNKYNVGDITPKEKRQIAVVARKNWDMMVKAHEPGTILSTYAYEGDGSGPARVKAYRAMGFGKPDPDLDNYQYARVTSRGIEPLDPSKGAAMKWYLQTGQYIPHREEEDEGQDFSERDADLRIEKALEIILFGDPEQE